MTADVHLLAAEANASVSAVCRVLGIPRSTCYARRNRKPSKRELETQEIDIELKALFHEHKGRYGSPRLFRLMRKTRRISEKRVARRMQECGLYARSPRKVRRTTVTDPEKKPKPNILARRFNGWEQPNRAWVGDITYIRTQAGWAFLAIVVDLYSRAIVGWSVSRACDTQLALRALDDAVARHGPPPGFLHHTDRGSTYTAKAYQDRLAQLGAVVSMSRKGNCWDNAVAESTFGTIKTEAFDDTIPVDATEVYSKLFEYIETYYNRVRLHSAIDYLTPSQVHFPNPPRESRTP